MGRKNESAEDLAATDALAQGVEEIREDLDREEERNPFDAIEEGSACFAPSDEEEKEEAIGAVSETEETVGEVDQADDYEERDPCRDCGNFNHDDPSVSCDGKTNICDEKRGYNDEMPERMTVEEYKHHMMIEEAPAESIPAAPEGFNADLPMSEPFQRALPVYLTDVELGCYSKEQAELWMKLGQLNQAKKDNAKTYAKMIEEVEEKLDKVSQIVDEGSAERPVECRWMFDYVHGVKKLIRLDSNTVAEEKPLTKEELDAYRQPSLISEGESIANAEALRSEAAEDVEDENPGDGMAEEENEAEGASGEAVSSNSTIVEEVSEEVSLDVEEVAPKDEIDKKRNCCMPFDRDHVLIGDTRILFCRECLLIHRKQDVSDPNKAKEIGFAPGEKLDADQVPPRIAP